MRLNSAYICVKDMNRAINFYEKFLDQHVDEKGEILSLFIFKGFRLLLFDYEKAGEKITFGDNCLLSFEVDDINKLKEKLDKLGVKIIFPITKIGDNYVLEFRDTEGNDIEVYSKAEE
ncbi:MAG: glyoxalase [Candidatus Levybacteria bacterium RIFCSPHIGHO2_01_FULL_36_15]|nr:MAG: glyoxalase [Candidatus Levybacteria bacterium RIFCSPHIGHO2_01_FULL_36_15]OGH37560.1 MAG: glyoxalase [Candidatus Levybacteria bacterium RIFCSPLOWO2_01_FULL_36_10]